MKRENPFIDIYKQCNSLSNAEKDRILHEADLALPIYLDVELTNCCNINCNMCPVGTGIMKRPKGFMKDAVFEKILENIKEYHIKGVRFIRWGEPTLHPKFLVWAEALKKEGVIVHFNTNGMLIDEELIEKIIELEIDSVKFSFQGINNLTYGEMRSGGSYSKLLDIIRMMYQKRGTQKAPYISVSTTTTYESEEEIASFKKEISPWCEEVNVGKTLMQHVDIDNMGLSEERRKVYEEFIKTDRFRMQHPAVCPEIWDKLSINWDGSVSACCSDYDNMMIVGNILEDDLKDIFMGYREETYRNLLKCNSYDKLELCRNCYEYIELKH